MKIIHPIPAQRKEPQNVGGNAKIQTNIHLNNKRNEKK